MSTDDERVLSFSNARNVGNELRAIYTELQYEPIELPCISIEERAAFIIDYIKALGFADEVDATPGRCASERDDNS